jgi:hypothetical protein
VGAFLSAVLERPRLEAVFAVPPSALHGGDRIYRIEDGRLKAVPVLRAGERRDGERLAMLVRARDEAAPLRDGMLVSRTHLPHAIDGLAVEVVGGGGAGGAAAGATR